MDGTETLEQMQSRHRREARDLQGRITNKKKNASKKTRKGVNDECAEMERQMRERHAGELRGLDGEDEEEAAIPDGEPPTRQHGGANGVAGQVEGMQAGGLAAKVPPTPPPQQQQQQQQQQQPAGKKRNRQKERLARRAAEVEAAALAAEEEAGNMTDHRAVEKTYMNAEFKKHGLREHEIRPDGHCLFSAVADQLAQLNIPLDSSGSGEEEGKGGGKKEAGYQVVRRKAAGYIEEHGDEYAGFLEEDLGSYVRKMRDTAEWGGQLELLALANVYGVEVHVVQDRRTEVIRPAATSAGAGEEVKRIWLAYYRHGYGLGEHYNSLRKA